MICILLSADIAEDGMDKTILSAVQDARISKQASITIIFLSRETPRVFRHRDIFTKYVDVGVRVYLEDRLEVLREIIARDCSKMYISIDDAKSAELLKMISVNLTVHEV